MVLRWETICQRQNKKRRREGGGLMPQARDISVDVSFGISPACHLIFPINHQARGERRGGKKTRSLLLLPAVAPMQHGSIARRSSWAAIDWLAMTHGEALDASELQQWGRKKPWRTELFVGARQPGGLGRVEEHKCCIRPWILVDPSESYRNGPTVVEAPRAGRGEERARARFDSTARRWLRLIGRCAAQVGEL